MKWLWVIVFLAFSFIPTLAASRKKVQAAAASDNGGDSEDEEDSFFNFDDVEAEEAAPAPEPYFTYESTETEVSHAAPEPPAPVAEEHAAAPAFDLRSAVIYQTVLTNKYIIPLEN